MTRNKESRLLTYFLFTMLALIHTIRRMFEGVRPFDWLMLAIEVAVLLLIAYEVRLTFIHRKKTKQLGKIVDRLAALMSQGQTIAESIPDPIIRTDRSPVLDWKRSADTWRTDTAQYLSGVSNRATSVFLLVSTTMRQYGDVYFTGSERDCREAILAHLENLQRIIENPEVYL